MCEIQQQKVHVKCDLVHTLELLQVLFLASPIAHLLLSHLRWETIRNEKLPLIQASKTLIMNKLTMETLNLNYHISEDHMIEQFQVHHPGLLLQWQQ